MKAKTQDDVSQTLCPTTLGPSNEEMDKRFRATVRLFDRLCHQWGLTRGDGSKDTMGKRMWLRDHCAIVVASMPLEDLDDV